MKLADALTLERNREEQESWNKIYLHKDGGFFHIYEWSAWLLKTLVCTEEFQKARGDEKMLSAKLYKTKKAEYIIIGFPLDSLSKYVPCYEEASDFGENTLLVTIDISLLTDASYKDMLSQYNEWRMNCEVKTSKSNNNNANSNNKLNNAMALSGSGLFAIVSQVLSYPIEKSTPSDNINFISGIKQQLASLL